VSQDEFNEARDWVGSKLQFGINKVTHFTNLYATHFTNPAENIWETHFNNPAENIWVTHFINPTESI
jgi:hypothetical protein